MVFILEKCSLHLILQQVVHHAVCEMSSCTLAPLQLLIFGFRSL
jgi:hypothetical protein